MLGVTHVHKGGGLVWQQHQSSGVEMYSDHLAALHHLAHSLTRYVVQHATARW